jgi:hypothetical protein
MTDINQNLLDQKLNELKEIYKELEQAEIKKKEDQSKTDKLDAFDLVESLIIKKKTKIEEINKLIKEIENTDHKNVEWILKRMEDFIKNMDCEFIEDCMERHEYLKESKIYQAEWDKCQKKA